MSDLTPALRSQAIQFLRDIANGADPITHKYGLCGNVRKKFGFDLERLFTSYIKVLDSYDRFSGIYFFPVKSDNFSGPSTAYAIALKNRAMFEGDYGQERRRLAGYLADAAERELRETVYV
jgi:uncharacterized protein YutD